ncbi:flagellar basal body P-ring protein FlgI [Tepidimonas taiwanensis]|uniref:Flagellar P-ring protein n=1 Tax=Tepidimonas taiwanensis TaxID=307486 RepID=A0A554XCH2_9BURK|nr:flagellar basal body P-ring protein FlgI [Tepidimonas taiwanensis]MCX7693285.1 flagellar basal body P-ring protein FlgI [Tepidimonas taiwanensis]MDM7464214.1 flagellar basal body P-ring protein FlgI [Tepidimonas taiwanensis]TSE33516.1 Flagellar P-ring protein [Tepidimonas taiwanensis]UBQ05782.1 flagellar basal body P-ring protein FlgI [Tepidimonas taiwanensis]
MNRLPHTPHDRRRWRAALYAVLTAAAASLLAVWTPAHATRIKDVAAVQGVRPNQLSGYGLVVGLDGTGDSSNAYTTQSLANYLQQMGLTLPPGVTVQPKNVAAVLVTAELPAFARPGQTIDVTVSSIGSAKSLRGGTLIQTPLRGADGQVYALAQGNLVVAGAGASAGGSSVAVNHLNAGRIPNGALVERAVPTPLLIGETVDLALNAQDFQTATRVAQAINRAIGDGTAQALDGRVVRVRAPLDPNERVAFLASLEDLPLELSAPTAKVILNARTGSVVLNQAVKLAPAAIAHGNLSITISSTPQVSQPGPFAPPGAQTVVTEKADIQVQQEGGKLLEVEASAQLADVVRALNKLGATPQDLLAILQAMKAAGALKAEIEVL